MIAGTSFQLLPSMNEVWRQAVQKMALTHHALELMDTAIELRNDPFALPMLCEDGLVVMTLKAQPDGTIEAEVVLALSFTKEHGAFKRQEQAMLAVARDAGASRISFGAVRRGWRRVVGPEWQRDGDFFSRRL